MLDIIFPVLIVSLLVIVSLTGYLVSLNKQGKLKTVLIIAAVFCTLAWVCTLSLALIMPSEVVKTEATTTQTTIEAEKIHYDDEHKIFVIVDNKEVKVYPESITKIYADPRKPNANYINVTVHEVKVTEGVKAFGVWLTYEDKGVPTSVIFD